jgi:hypothetical protein
VAATTVRSAAPPEEAPSFAAALVLVLEPCEDRSLSEAPTRAARLDIAVEPYQQ